MVPVGWHRGRQSCPNTSIAPGLSRPVSWRMTGFAALPQADQEAIGKTLLSLFKAFDKETPNR